MGFQAFCNSIGIENYYGKDEYNNNKDDYYIWGIWDEPFLQFAANKLKLQKQPFISTIFTLSSHDPFKIPAKFNNKFRKGQHPIYQTLAYTDFSIKKFFESIKHEDWFENTIFVISGDHTSSHASIPEFSKTIGRFRVPIFFYCPNLLKPEKSKKIFKQSDVFASVLGLIGHEKPILSFGKNLFDNSSKNYAVNYFNDYQWFADNLVLIQKNNKTSSLYNFKDDKLLQKDLSAIMPNIKTKMQSELNAIAQHYNNRMIDNELVIK